MLQSYPAIELKWGEVTMPLKGKTMAENETLDLESRYSRRWQQWGKEWASGKSVSELSDSALSKLIRTIRNVQKYCAEENGVPLSVVVDAVVGERHDLSAIARSARKCRGHLQLLQQQANQGLSREQIFENWINLTFERFSDQAAKAYMPDGNADLLARLECVKEELRYEAVALAKKLAGDPDTRLNQPKKSASQREGEEIDQLSMTVVAPSLRPSQAKPLGTVIVEF